MTPAYRDPRAGGGRRPKRRLGRRAAAPLLAWVLAGALAACSPPDWWNPFGDDDGETWDGTAGESYPNLARVPDRAPRPTPKSLRRSLTEGLIADRANALYTDEVLTSESTAVPPAAPPPKGRPRVEIVWEKARYLTDEEKAAAAAAAEEAAAREAEAGAPEPIEIVWEADRLEPEPPPAPGSPEAAPRVPVEPAGLDAQPETAPESNGAESNAAESTAAVNPDEIEITWEMARVEPMVGPAAEPVAEPMVGPVVGPVAEPEEAASAEAASVAATPEETAALAAVPEEAESAAQPLATIGFAVASSELNDRDSSLLREVLALQMEMGGRLHLIGYADRPAKVDDSVEQRMADLNLSLERASAVASALGGLGADKDSLRVRAATAIGAGRRRSEIRIVEIFLEN